MRARRLLSLLTAFVTVSAPLHRQLREVIHGSGERTPTSVSSRHGGDLPFKEPPSTHAGAQADAPSSSYTTQIPLRAVDDNEEHLYDRGYALRPEELQKLLPDIPHGLPLSSAFDVERSSSAGEKQWLVTLLPALQRRARATVYLPEKDALWNSPASHALSEVVRRQPYSKSLTMVMEHGFFFLFERDIFLAPDVPLPHILYEDMMRARTFASRQNAPEEQFHLSSSILVTLLGLAAYHCSLDQHYFTSAESLLFRRIEQQQHVDSEVLSAYIAVCAAAGQIQKAMANAELMTSQGLVFSKRAFAAMMHPTISPVQWMAGIAPQAAKGMLLQERLCESLSTCYSATAVALHAMFVQCALTLRHKDKWEVVRVAFRDLARFHQPFSSDKAGTRVSDSGSALVGEHLEVSPRTVQLIVETYAREKGIRCGPETVKAILAMILNNGNASTGTATGMAAHAFSSPAASDAAYVLLRARRNESTALFSEQLVLPAVTFTEAEAEGVLARVPESHAASRMLRPVMAALLDAEPSERATAPMTGAPLHGAGHAKKRETEGLRSRRKSMLQEVLRRLTAAAKVAASSSQQQQQQGQKVVLESAAPASANQQAREGESGKGDGEMHVVSSSNSPLTGLPSPSLSSQPDVSEAPTDADAGTTAEVRALVARLQYLDTLGNTQGNNGGRSRHSSGSVWCTGSSALSLLEVREEERRAANEHMLAALLEEANNPTLAAGSTLPLFMGSSSTSQPSPSQQPSPSVYGEEAIGCRAWAASVMRKAAEQRSLERELAEGIAKYM